MLGVPVREANLVAVPCLELDFGRLQGAPTIEELYSNVEAESPDELVVHAATNAIENREVLLSLP